MSATRDTSMGIGFINLNLYKLYKKAQSANPILDKDESVTESTVEPTARVIPEKELSSLKVTKFQPRNLGAVTGTIKTATSAAAEQLHIAPATQSLDELKKNIEDLQDLHSKLRFMLHELEDLVGKK